MLNLIKKWNYGNYSSNNYGAHCLAFQLGGVTVWFSYDTPVALEAPGRGLVVRVNDWGPTTGKHLNWIDGGNHELRITGSEFEKQLQSLAKEFNYSGPIAIDQASEEKINSSSLGMASKVSKLFEIMDGGKDPASVNKWQKKFFEAGVPEIRFPDDWDELPEEEKKIRLQGAIKEGLDNG